MSSPEETLRHYRICHGIQFDGQSRRQLCEAFLDEQGEETDEEQGEEKADKGKEGKGTEYHMLSALGMTPTKPKRRRTASGNGNGDPGLSSRKKVRL
jgi:hypothetical protein